MIIALFTLVPLLVGMVVEYAVFRFTMRETGRGRRLLRLLRLVPPLAAAAVIGGIAVGRWQLWQSQLVSPLTQLLFFPGVPGFFFLLGLLLGWRLWKRRWSPRVLKEG